MIFHGLQDIQVHQATIVNNVQHLEVALVRAILEIIRPVGATDAESVAEPLRTVGTIPQVIVDGTFIDLTDDERKEVLYRFPFKPITETTSGKNDDDGDLTLSVKQGLGVWDTLKAPLVDKRITFVAGSGVQLVPQR
ncbi:MAG: hypothetical protein GEU75_09880 [Dehalococcoidia bacterium]|nr:hypothetical protein [Dehalococcoidia bacterium]